MSDITLTREKPPLELPQKLILGNVIHINIGIVYTKALTSVAGHIRDGNHRTKGGVNRCKTIPSLSFSQVNVTRKVFSPRASLTKLDRNEERVVGRGNKHIYTSEQTVQSERKRHSYIPQLLSHNNPRQIISLSPYMV